MRRLTLTLLALVSPIAACGASKQDAGDNDAGAGSSAAAAGAASTGGTATGGHSGSNTAGTTNRAGTTNTAGTTGGAGRGGSAGSGGGGTSGERGGMSGAGEGGEQSGGSSGTATSGAGGDVGGGGFGGDAGMSGSAGSAGAAPICEGFPAANRPSCTDQADCASSGYCRFPGDPPACGMPCLAERTCESDDDCAKGVCVESQAGCCPEGTLETQCRAACTETSCPANYECGESGHCECTAAACGENHSCESVNGGPRSCVRRACTTESDCDCGVCSDGLCSADPSIGYCVLPVP